MQEQAAQPRIAVAGAGAFGRNHLRVIRDSARATLAGVFDIDGERAAAAAAEFGCHALGSLAGIATIADAAVVAVPTTHHHAVATELLEAGLDVLVEKPITVDLIQAKRLVDFSKKANCILQVGHLERFNPAVRRMREIIGQPVYIETKRLSYPTDRNLDVGVVWDLMIHDLDILINLVNSPVVDIHAIGVSVYSEFEDVAQVQLTFKNGCMASLLASRIGGEKLRQLKATEINGRTLCLDFIDQTLVAMHPPRSGRVIPPEILDVEKDEIGRAHV